MEISFTIYKIIFLYVNKRNLLKTVDFARVFTVLPRSHDVRAKLEFGALN